MAKRGEFAEGEMSRKFVLYDSCVLSDVLKHVMADIDVCGCDYIMAQLNGISLLYSKLSQNEEHIAYVTYDGKKHYGLINSKLVPKLKYIETVSKTGLSLMHVWSCETNQLKSKELKK